jgi:hypothetical protein
MIAFLTFQSAMSCPIEDFKNLVVYHAFFNKKFASLSATQRDISEHKRVSQTCQSHGNKPGNYRTRRIFKVSGLNILCPNLERLLR